MVKEKIPSIKWLMLLGGEPTIHPQLLEFCSFCASFFGKEMNIDSPSLTVLVAQIEPP